MKIQRLSELRDQDLGDEIMVFEDRTDQVHVLNATAAFVWRHAVVPVGMARLEELARETFEVEPEDDVRAILERAVEMLKDKGLVLEVT